jgi:hypothetical protein
MAELWVQVLIALIAGVLGAAAMLMVCRRARRKALASPVSQAMVADPPPAATDPLSPSVPRLDRWLHQMRRCEQAVRRAARAVDSVSSTPARTGLQSVVRRMDAELPNVRALVELGRSLDAGGRDGEPATGRVLGQLDDAARRFGMLTDQVLQAVVELVAAPDLGRVHQQVAALRDQFPLQRPMSAALGGQPESADKALIDTPG